MLCIAPRASSSQQQWQLHEAFADARKDDPAVPTVLTWNEEGVIVDAREAPPDVAAAGKIVADWLMRQEPVANDV